MKVYAMIADGTEEAELLIVVDIMRRAGIDAQIVSVDGKTVTSSHGVTIAADRTVAETELTDCDLIFVPGGMPGSTRLAACEKLITAIGAMLDGGKRVAAVCAAPALVLGAHGFLTGKRATCFPGFEDRIVGAAEISKDRVVTDGLVTTAQGLGCCIDLGLEIVRLLVGADAAETLKARIRY